jgi:hypothetical protein
MEEIKVTKFKGNIIYEVNEFNRQDLDKKFIINDIEMNELLVNLFKYTIIRLKIL